ncbi:hypothetical protein K466DRAFT_571918 [Polyporus arcularius HHB13444]|uniref:Uncharacterized protein n=1 Tax=Polyporus arcularius HHB13444 TaxID=1314778 RepID=A0A5C3PXP8_9APHY|nr:hypothetical protein K466DRAFT_571918 [Polyporus arcularius HHB13444]
MGGALGVFFLRNTYRAIQYARIVNVKNKSLFYMLVVSQALGILVSVTFVVADFDRTLNCTAVGMLKKGGVLVSSTLLVTGILGTKAYRCLSNAGFVIVTLALMRAAIIAVSGLVLVQYKGGRRFTGTCETVTESTLLPVSIILQFMEACFICICFLWAVYRSYRSPADHARLSLPLEEEDETSSVETNDKDDDHGARTSRRGWWDYVPSPSAHPSRRSSRSAQSTPKDMVGQFRRWWTGEPMLPSTVFQRKPSLPGELPIPQPPRMSSASNIAPVRMSASREPERPRGGSPPPPSVMERIIRYVPRAELLRSMLKNELLYTTFITAVLLVIAIVMLVGVTQQLLLGANSWIILDWVIISFCTMHTFGRVAHRHEREAWLQDPANWKPIHHAQIEDETALRPKNSRRAWSPVSVASNWRQRYRQRGESDAPSSVGRYRSGEFSEPFTPSRPSRVRSGSLTRSPEVPVSVSRSTSVASSTPMHSASVDSMFRPPVARHGNESPMILPSPEYPLTGVSTPHSGAASDSHAILSRAGTASPSARRSPSQSPGPDVGRSHHSHSRRHSPIPRSPPSRRVSRAWDPENPEPPDPLAVLEQG